MTALLSGTAFAKQIAVRLSLFGSLIAFFPYIIFGLLLALATSGLGGLIALNSPLVHKALIAASLLPLLKPCMARMRSLGLPIYWGLLVPFLLLQDGVTLIGANLGSRLALGLNLPFYAMTAAVILVAMALAIGPLRGDSSDPARLGVAVKAAAVFAIIVLIMALMGEALSWYFRSAIPSHVPVKDWNASLQMSRNLGQWITVFRPFACLALVGVVAWLVVLSRRSGSRPGGNSGPNIVSSLTSKPSVIANSVNVTFGKR